MYVDRNSDPQPLNAKHSGEVGGIAYDWIANNIYWTDIKYKWVRFLSTIVQFGGARVIDGKTAPGLAERIPYAIALSPRNG